MKHITLFMLTCIFLLGVFSACAPAAPSSALQSQPNASTATQDIEKSAVESGPVRLLSQRNGVCGGSSSEAGYYYPVVREDGSFNLTYLDYATQQEVVLCAVPNCTHAGESCTSWFPARQGGLVPVNVGEQLLMISRGVDLLEEQSNAPQIITMDVSGANRKLLTQFASAEELLPPFAGNDAELFCLYQRTTNKESNAKAETFLVKIDLQTGQCSKLQAFEQQAVKMIGAAGDTILLQKSTPNGMNLTHALLRYYIANDTLTEIATWNNDEKLCFTGKNGYGFVNSDGTVTYCDWNDATGQGKTLDGVQLPIDGDWGLEMTDFLDSFDDKVIFRNVFMGKEPSDRKDTLYGLSLSDNTLTELTLMREIEGGSSAPVEIVCALKERLLVISASHFREKAMLSEDGTPYQTQALCDQYALIPKDAYWNSTPMYTEIEGVLF